VVPKPSGLSDPGCFEVIQPVWLALAGEFDSC